VPFPDERPGDEDDRAADPPLLPRAGDDRQRRVGLADADVERDETTTLGEHAAGPGDLDGLEFRRLRPPAGDLQRLGRVGRDDAAAGDAVVRVDELFAAALIGRDPRPKRLVPLLPERDAPLGEVLLLRGLLLAGPRPRGAVGRLALGLEKLGVVVDVAEEGERLGGDRRLVGVGVVVALELDKAPLPLERDLAVAAVDRLGDPARDEVQGHIAEPRADFGEVFEGRRPDRLEETTQPGASPARRRRRPGRRPDRGAPTGRCRSGRRPAGAVRPRRRRRGSIPSPAQQPAPRRRRGCRPAAGGT
jgi:hypothetical protein